MPGRGGSRPYAKNLGECDPFVIDIAPLNIFENQVIPVGVHNLSKSFRPYRATIRVLSLGTKFISKWKKAKSNKHSKILEIFTEDSKTQCFLWKTNQNFCLDRQFRLKSHYVAKDTFNEVDEFCWQLITRHGIKEMVETHVKSDCVTNRSKKKRTALIKLIGEKKNPCYQ